jgi:hypothetical protein
MKLRSPGFRKNLAAFTLTDLLFSSTFLCTGMAAIMWCHVMGLKLHELVDTQLSAAAHERKVWDYLVTDLENAQRIQIGSFQQNSFTSIPSGSLQQGSALQVYPILSETNQYIRYFLDNGYLKRYVSSNNSLSVLSTYIKTTKPFQAESSVGTVLTNQEALFVVSVGLSFSQFQESGSLINSTNRFRSYDLSTKVAFRGGS